MHSEVLTRSLSEYNVYFIGGYCYLKLIGDNCNSVPSCNDCCFIFDLKIFRKSIGRSNKEIEQSNRKTLLSTT